MKNRPIIGERVRSRYKARWYGVIEDYEIKKSPFSGRDTCIAHVRITHDKRGRPARKRKLYKYNWCWFEYTEAVDGKAKT